jgi:two-component sensor histidine kinase
MNYQELLYSPILPSQVAPLIEKASRTNASVMIAGEKGTGKELVAKIIHHIGEWKRYSFYKIDCRTLSEDSFDNQLSRLFKEVHYGTLPATLYLKDVQFLTHADQFRLLRLVEEAVFENAHGKEAFKNLRFICSSEHLRETIAQGRFLEDLYDRLNTFTIHIPSLRNRAEEVATIAQYILKEQSKKLNIRQVAITNDVATRLQNYWWPGNLRELEHVIVRSAIFSEGRTLMAKDLVFEAGDEKSPFIPLWGKVETQIPPLREKTHPDKENLLSPPLFILELIHRIKNPLVSIKTFTQLLREKFNDVEFREYFYRIVTEDIERIDSVLNGLLNYIKINTPITKTNTVHTLLEEALNKWEAQIGERGIKLFKKFEKDLPEITLDDEQLRYIFGSILQFVISSVPPDGSIGFLTKTLPSQKTALDNSPRDEGSGNFIEILIVFSGFKKVLEHIENALGIPVPQNEEMIELELRLVKELVQKNSGSMKFEVNRKKLRTLISLRFPIERRIRVFYPTIKA